jgi:hypothetical protein
VGEKKTDLLLSIVTLLAILLVHDLESEGKKNLILFQLMMRKTSVLELMTVLFLLVLPKTYFFLDSVHLFMTS